MKHPKVLINDAITMSMVILGRDLHNPDLDFIKEFVVAGLTNNRKYFDEMSDSAFKEYLLKLSDIQGYQVLKVLLEAL